MNASSPSVQKETPVKNPNTEIFDFPGADARSRAMQNAAQNIDATLFSGDPDREMRQTLRNLMARWERKMDVWDLIDDECEKEVSEEGMAKLRETLLVEKGEKKTVRTMAESARIRLLVGCPCVRCQKVIPKGTDTLYIRAEGFICSECENKDLCENEAIDMTEDEKGEVSQECLAKIRAQIMAKQPKKTKAPKKADPPDLDPSHVIIRTIAPCTCYVCKGLIQPGTDAPYSKKEGFRHPEGCPVNPPEKPAVDRKRILADAEAHIQQEKQVMQARAMAPKGARVSILILCPTYCVKCSTAIQKGTIATFDNKEGFMHNECAKEPIE